MTRGSADSLLQRELLDTIKSLRSTIESLQLAIEDLRKELAKSKERERLAREEIDAMKKRFFGRSSEKHVVQSEGQLNFFNEVELEADKQQEEEFPYMAEPEKEEKKRKPRILRKEMFKGLPVEDEIIDLPEEQKVYSECGSPMEDIGQRVICETLKYIPARLTIVRTITRVYGCPQCKQGEDAHIVRAEVPDPLIPHNYASESVSAHAMYQKFANVVPLYRQEKVWEQMGAFLSWGTLGRWIKICLDEYFVPIYDYFYRLLLGRQFALADETRIQVLKEPERNPEMDSLMWIFRSEEDGLPSLILYRYTEIRAKFNAVEFLKGFKGYLMTDGYQGYNNLPDIMCKACWAHICRKFCDAVPSGKQDALSEPAVQRASSTVTDCSRLNAIAGKASSPTKSVMSSGTGSFEYSGSLLVLAG